MDYLFIICLNDISGYVSRAVEVSQSQADIVQIRIAPKLNAAVANGKKIDRCTKKYKPNWKIWSHRCKSLPATCGQKQKLDKKVSVEWPPITKRESFYVKNSVFK